MSSNKMLIFSFSINTSLEEVEKNIGELEGKVSGSTIKLLKNQIGHVNLNHINDVAKFMLNNHALPISITKTLLTKGLEDWQFQFIFKNLCTFWTGIRNKIPEYIKKDTEGTQNLIN